MSKPVKPRIAILISGTGSNMDAIIRACASGRLDADIAIVISDNPGAPGIKKARSAGIETFVSRYGRETPREESESEIADVIMKRSVDWVVLAGFMKILSPGFVKTFRGRIVNIHPSLLPSFPGAHAIRDVLEAGADFTGVTIHIVDELVDHGPIIAQEEVPILPNDTEKSLAERIHEVEHRLYPRTLQQLLHDDV
ncbi:MAG: phosphoribosylglycinamide formyltransferase [Synergistaceae bacterium]|jgi:formyltetrahydrofolate-dependent phosphoribosylglycinamide formyltransferase|nr:phosphoribosylglycinamide formyltransferase [Synergistaceae bacterium]